MITWFALVLSLLHLQSTAGSLNIDLVIVIHGNLQWWYASMAAVKNTLGEDLPKLFQIGDDQTRLALIMNTDFSTGYDPTTDGLCPDAVKPGRWGLLALTGNFTEFNRTLVSMAKGCTMRDLAEPFKIVRKIFDVQASRPRVVLVLSIFEKQAGKEANAKAVSDQAQAIAGQLRRQGVVIVVFYETQGNVTHCKADFEQLASTSNFAFNIKQRFHEGSEKFDADRLKVFVNETTKYLCRYETNCFYAGTREKCERSSYQPSFSHLMDKRGNCSFDGQSTATPTICDHVTKCEEVCDDLWPWKTKCGCGTIERKGAAPLKQLELCTPSRECATTCDPDAPSDDTTTDESSEIITAVTKPPSKVGMIVGIVIVFIFAVVTVVVVIFVLRKKRAAAIPKKGKKGGLKKATGKKSATTGIAGKKVGKGKKKAESYMETGTEPDSEKSDKSSKKSDAETDLKADDKTPFKKLVSKSPTGKKLRKGKKAESEESEQESKKMASSKAESENPKPKSKEKAKIACKIPAKKGKIPKKKKK